MGKATSFGIKQRAVQTLLEEMEDAPERVNKYMEVAFDFNDTITEWWTGTEAVDTDADVDERLTDLFAYMQFCGGNSAILVGHSLLFREIMKRYTSEECKQARREPGNGRGSHKFVCSSSQTGSPAGSPADCRLQSVGLALRFSVLRACLTRAVQARAVCEACGGEAAERWVPRAGR